MHDIKHSLGLKLRSNLNCQLFVDFMGYWGKCIIGLFPPYFHISLLSLTLIFYIFTTQCHTPLIFQTMHSVRSNNLSLNNQRFTPSCCKNIGIRKFELVTRTHFIYFLVHNCVLFQP